MNRLEEDSSAQIAINFLPHGTEMFVRVPVTADEVFEALSAMMVENESAEAVQKSMIVEFLEGEVINIHTFSDGDTFKSLPATRTQNRRFDCDEGPMTPGMGCYAPFEAATPSVMEEIERLIIKPTFDGLREES